MTGERIFQILAAVLAGAAAYFLWRGNIDAMFAAAVVGACCFFISIRFQVKERLKQRRAHAAIENEDEMPEEEPAHDETEGVEPQGGRK